jgi:hypothetical protein
LRAVFTAWYFLMLACSAQQPKRYDCQYAAKPPTIDGKLDDAAWQGAPWTDYFVDIQGAARPQPRFRTRAKMLWDDRYLYFAAELEEPHISGALTAHDSVIFHDNDFEIFLDPNGTGRGYFEFEINALNTSWDLFLDKPYRLQGHADNSWDIPGLRTAVHIRGTLNDARDRDLGWSVEIAMPWTAFVPRSNARMPPQLGDTWRVNFSRVEWMYDVTDGRYVKRRGLPEDNWVWSPQGDINMHIPEHWGYVRFLR